MMVGIDQGCPSVLALSNRIRREAIGLKDTGLPLDAFPQKLQGIIFDVTNIEQFNIEYLAMSMLSAAATAIGNSCQIRIRGSWRSSPALYVILIGRPGQGKTPPLTMRIVHFKNMTSFRSAGTSKRTSAMQSIMLESGMATPMIRTNQFSFKPSSQTLRRRP